MKPIRVLHITELGVENYYLNNLIDFTDKSEVEFSFLNFGKPDCGFVEGIKKRSCNVYPFDYLVRTRFAKAMFDVRMCLKRENPDIVHVHLFFPSLLGLIAAKSRKRKTVLTRHHSDALHSLPSRLKRSVFLTLENYISKNSDQIIAPSKMVLECLVDWENVPSKKVTIIPYGQAAERFNAITDEKIEKKRAELGMNGQLSIVCVSRLFDRKGHKFLFEALAPLIRNGLNTRVYLVGSGDYKANLELLANELGILQNIEFLGWRDDGLEIIAAGDIIVHPSLEDALSSSLIESLMLARPIIATDISGAADTLNGGKYGILVPPSNSAAIRDALVATIENLDFAREKAKEGRKYLLEYMSAKRVAEEYTKIYQKVVE